MISARPVAGFALALGERRARIRNGRVLGLEDFFYRVVAVAGETGVSAFFRIRRRNAPSLVGMRAGLK